MVINLVKHKDWRHGGRLAHVFARYNMKKTDSDVFFDLWSSRVEPN